MDHLIPGSKGSKPKETASADAVDVRRYLGPDYCPELRIYDGAQLIRTYQHGHQGDQNFVTWQASFGKTARECLYDTQGNVTLKIGIAGRAVAGPKGGSDPIPIPIKIAVVKYQDSVLTTERLTIPVTIPQQGSTVFSQVKEITVPSPGSNRDYIIYVGFDVGDWDLDAPRRPGGGRRRRSGRRRRAGGGSRTSAAAPARSREQAAGTGQHATGAPSGGFVLSQ